MSERIRNSEINHYWEGREWLDQGYGSLGPGLNSSAYRNHQGIPNQKEQGESKTNLKTGRRYSHRKESFWLYVCVRERQTHRQNETRERDGWREVNAHDHIQWEEIEYSRELKNMNVKVAQLSPALCDPMDCTVHGILQARILEWVATPRGSSQPRDWTQVSHIAGRFFTNWAMREALKCHYY